MSDITGEAGGRTLLVVLALVCFPATVLPGEAGGEKVEMSDFDDFDELYLGELLNTVCIAARHEQDIADAPSAVTVISREDIETSGARTLPEALRAVPNMDVYMIKPLWYAVGLRGGTSEASDSLLLLVDGRDVTWEFLGAPIWTVQHFSMDEIERIEVIRGPGSSLYGANAYVGVVNVITRAPGEGPTASASLRGGERGFSELAARGTVRLGPVALSADAGVVGEDLWSSRGVTGRDVVRGRLQGSIDLGPAGKLLLDGGAYQGAGLLHTDLGKVKLHDAQDYYGRLRFEYGDLMVQAAYTRVKLDAEIDMRLYYEDLDMELARAPPIIGYFDKIGVQAQHGAELLHNLFTYGAGFVFNGYHSDLLVDPDQYEYRMGLFVQDEVDLSAIVKSISETEIPRLVLTLGLRFDYNNMPDIERTDHTFSPRAALVFRPVPDHSIRFGYAHAFLKPTFFESSLNMNLIDVNNLNFTNLDVGNHGLKNQTIDSVELGYRVDLFEKRLRVGVDLAFNWYRNGIGFRFRPTRMQYRDVAGVLIPDLNSPGMMTHDNDKDGNDGHNVDLQVIARPTDASRVFLTAGYRQIYDAKSHRFGRSEPVWRFAVGIDLKGAAGWQASLRAYGQDGRVWSMGNPESSIGSKVRIEIPPYFFISARLAWTLAAHPLAFQIGVEAFDPLGTGIRDAGGVAYPNDIDHGGDLMGRRIILFLRGEI